MSCTQACDQKLQSVACKCQQGKVKEENFPHVKKLKKKKKKSDLADEASLYLLLSQTASIYGCPTNFAACVDSHPQVVNAKSHITHQRHLPTSPVSSVLLFFLTRRL